MRKAVLGAFLLVLTAAALAAMGSLPPNLLKALEIQTQLVRDNPQDASIFNDLGNLLVLAGELDQAEQAYARAVELDPEKVSAHFNLGLLHQQKGDLTSALEHYRRVVEIQPDHAWGHYQIGAILERQGDNDRAIKSYARAFALNAELGFAEVNPHVIDNGLVAQAMILAHSDRSKPMAPKSYEDPSRIAHLLVGSEAAAMDDGETPPSGGENVSPSEGPSIVPPAPQGGDEGVGGRTLTEDDLGSRSSNQISSPSARGAPGRGRGDIRTRFRRSGAVPPPPSLTPGTSNRGRNDQPTAQRPLVGVIGVPQPTPPPPANGREVAPPPPTTEDDRGPDRRPGTSSTGRLEIRLGEPPASAVRAS